MFCMMVEMLVMRKSREVHAVCYCVLHKCSRERKMIRSFIGVDFVSMNCVLTFLVICGRIGFNIRGVYRGGREVSFGK